MAHDLILIAGVILGVLAVDSLETRLVRVNRALRQRRISRRDER